MARLRGSCAAHCDDEPAQRAVVGGNFLQFICQVLDLLVFVPHLVFKVVYVLFLAFPGLLSRHAVPQQSAWCSSVSPSPAILAPSTQQPFIEVGVSRGRYLIPLESFDFLLVCECPQSLLQHFIGVILILLPIGICISILQPETPGLACSCPPIRQVLGSTSLRGRRGMLLCWCIRRSSTVTTCNNSLPVDLGP